MKTEEELGHFINSKIKRGVLSKKRLFFFIQIALIILISTITVRAQVTNFYLESKIENNILGLESLGELYLENYSSDNIPKIKFEKNQDMNHQQYNNEGMEFEFNNFSIQHLSKSSYNLRLSDSAMSFINRLNKYNYLSEFNNLKIKEEKIDFSVIKLSYKKEIFNTSNLIIEINSDFNYYNGSNYEYNIYDLNINVGKSTNPFLDLPLVINGNIKEYFNNNSSKNTGAGFGLGFKLFTSKNLKAIFLVDNIGAHINWKDLRFDNLNIDTETEYKDEFDNLKYNSTISGRWEKFDFEMPLPLKVKLSLSKKLKNILLSSNLSWQEWELGDIARKEFWNWDNSIGYRFNQDNSIHFGYNLFADIYNFKFKNDKFNLGLYLKSFDLKDSNQNALKVSYNLKF